jgi:asparagine synthase (glutamine-hydrolysing)
LSGKSIITFNGEIYNFKILAEKLNLSNSVSLYGDTRVLIEYIERFGIKDALRSIDGMYAFAYYTFEQDSLYIARDKYGQKPLYYFIGNNNSIIFSSDILAVKSALNVSRQDFALNKKSVEEYFKYGYIGGHQSIYDGISKLPANSYMEIKRSGCSIEISTEKHDYKVNKEKLNDVEQAVTKFDNIFQKVLGDFQYADVLPDQWKMFVGFHQWSC